MRCGAIPIALNVIGLEVLGSADFSKNCNHSMVKQIEKLIEEKEGKH